MGYARPLLVVAAVVAASLQTYTQESRGGWRYFGGDKGFTRYSPLEQINRDNVRNLRITWRRPAVNPKMIAAFPDTRPNSYLRATPIVVDGVLYTQDAHGLVIALPVLTIFGLILGWLRLRTDSLFPPIILHAIFNGAALVAAVLI